MKVCIHCGERKPLSLLVKNKNMKDGYKNECKPCHNRLQKERYYSVPKEERHDRDKYLQRMYRMSEDEYDRRVSNINSCCECCGKESNRLFVDHCHDTGRVRGLLCQLCNSGIGMLGDNLEGLIRAVRYLEKEYG